MTCWRLSRLAIFIMAFAALPLVAGCARGSAGSFDYAKDPVAVVLIHEGRRPSLVTVDLESFKVVRRVKLRSLAYSMDGHPGSRTIVTAQCGGIGPDADKVAAVYRVGARERVRYVRLPIPNPSEVALAGTSAYVIHGFEQEQGTCFSVFDLKKPREVRSSHLPVSSGIPAVVGGRIVVPTLVFPAGPQDDVASRRAALFEVDGTRVQTMSAELPLSVVDIYHSSETSRVIVGGSYPYSSDQAPSRWALMAIDPLTGKVLQYVDAPWAKDGVFVGAMTFEGLVVCDSDGGATDDPGRSIVTLDPATLAPLMRRDVTGLPTAVAAWRDKTLIVDGERGELLMYEPGQREPERVLKVSSEPRKMGSIVVFP